MQDDPNTIQKTAEKIFNDTQEWRVIRNRFASSVDRFGSEEIKSQASSMPNKAKRGTWVAWLLDSSFGTKFVSMTAKVSNTTKIQKEERTETWQELMTRYTEEEAMALIESSAIIEQPHPGNSSVRVYLDMHRYTRTTSTSKVKEIATGSTKDTFEDTDMALFDRLMTTQLSTSSIAQFDSFMGIEVGSACFTVCVSVNEQGSSC